MTDKPVVDYFSDVLCVWAWIAQRRIDQLLADFGERIELQYHYLDIFGDSHTKIQTQWDTQGLYNGFSEHVVHSAEKFEHAPVNPKIWSTVRPATSANAHLILKGAELVAGTEASKLAALNIRKAFFIEAQDIGELHTLKQILEKQGLDITAIEDSLADGRAMAALMNDYQQAKAQCLKGSPSFVLDAGRQTLYGNVGYRVLHSNVEELLYHPEEEASWC